MCEMLLCMLLCVIVSILYERWFYSAYAKKRKKEKWWLKVLKCL